MGVPTRIESGSIWVSKDTVVARKGDVVSPKLASLLSKLDMKPIKAGISINAVLWNDKVLTSEDVRIDVEATSTELKRAIVDANKLAYYIKYPIKELVPLYLQEANSKALALALNAEYPTSETIPYLLQRAQTLADILKKRTKEKGYGE